MNAIDNEELEKYIAILREDTVIVPEASPIPRIDRPDVEIAVVNQWNVMDSQRSTDLAEASFNAWQRTPGLKGLVSLNFFLSTDGQNVLSYAQWNSQAAYMRFAETHSNLIDAQSITYRLYRSAARDGDIRIPGCMVIVSVEFDGPDMPRQRQWIDAVFEALDGETERPHGGIFGHFHVSTDGTRVLNYAGWTDEHAHRDALEKSGQGTIGSGILWQRVRTFPGVVASGFKRYRFYRSFIPQTRGQRNAG
jgi:hypothetical protein